MLSKNAHQNTDSGDKRIMSGFSLYGFWIQTDDSVYEPSDDTFLLADSIIENKSIFANCSVLEIGCGAGLLSIIASGYCRHVTAIDINKKAVDLSAENMRLNNISNMVVLRSNLFEDIDRKFNIMIFNTPYLPQSDEETIDSPINLAWDGGKDGRKVIDRFLKEAKSHLNSNGRLIFLESSLSSYNRSLDYLEKHDFTANIISRKKLSFEELVVIIAQKRD